MIYILYSPYKAKSLPEEKKNMQFREKSNTRKIQFPQKQVLETALQ
jgi:hypothetical protein